MEPTMTRLARGGALSLAGAVCAGALGLALVVVVAHVYSQQVAGAFFAATSLFVILGAVSGLGSDAGLVRWLPRQLALGDTVAARRTVPIALVPVMVTASVAAISVAAAAPWLARLVDGGHPAEAAAMLRVLAVFLPIAAAQDALLAATRGHSAMRPTVLIEKMFRQAAQVAGVVIASLVADHPAALALAWGFPYLPGLVAAAMSYARLARRAAEPAARSRGTGAARRPAKDQPAPDRPATAGLIREFWSYTAPRAIAQICQTALQRADIVLIAALASPLDAAIYTAATRFMVIGQLGTQAVQQVMQPVISRLLALSDNARAQRVFALSTTWSIALTWPVHLAVATAAPTYLGFFGREYAGAGQAATVILALAMLVATSSGPVDVMLLMAGRSGLSLANNAAALAVNLTLNVLLIPRYGILGAALAWAAALITRNLLPVVQVRRMLGMTPAGGGLLWAGSSAVLSFAVLPLLARALLGSGAAAAGAGLVCGAAVYLALLWMGRGRLGLAAFTSLLPGRKPAEPVLAAAEVPMTTVDPRP
ncbi:MAG: polysaccharide biosynthesis protein [Streptosporangiaceae bacterium]|nr:polysaccharide biosynthesis protein [Streptosporangiaceae bacterium]